MDEHPFFKSFFWLFRLIQFTDFQLQKFTLQWWDGDEAQSLIFILWRNRSRFWRGDGGWQATGVIGQNHLWRGFWRGLDEWREAHHQTAVHHHHLKNIL